MNTQSQRTRILRPAIGVLLTLGAVLCKAVPAAGWGRAAHQMINAAAISTLPQPLRAYFQPHQMYLVEHASDPDALADKKPGEQRHHFADIEAYDSYPFLSFQQQFVMERLNPSPAQRRNGDAMWQIELFTLRLAADFRLERWDPARLDAVFAAHYAADLTQPLHTVLNYDGQLTGQNGIHRRYETGVVGFFANRWVLQPQPAGYITNLRARIFEAFLQSYRARIAIFNADREARSRWGYDDPRFLPDFAQRIGARAKTRVEAAASLVGSLWYTAWVRAGKPDLHDWKTLEGAELQDHGCGSCPDRLLAGELEGIPPLPDAGE